MLQTKNLIAGENFNADLFLTSEGKNLLDYFEYKFPNHFQLFSLNELLLQALHPILESYFENFTFLMRGTDGQIAKEIAYKEMIEFVDNQYMDDIITPGHK